MTISKENVRKQALIKRDALSSQERASKSSSICHSLELMAQGAFGARGIGASSVVGTPTIAVYSALRSEVNLRHFIGYAFCEGWDVCFPVMVDVNRHARSEFLNAYAASAAHPHAADMVFVHMTKERYKPDQVEFLHHPAHAISVETLEKDGWGVVDPSQIDMVVVPMVAFDSNNHRLGYGGGNYDWFLSQVRSDALVVGVAYQEQEVAKVPMEGHDIKLPEIITD